MNEDPTTIEQKNPIPLESLEPLPEQNTGREWEKGQYWNRLLTGDLSTVPEAVRHRAGAAGENRPQAEQDYRLAASINRSWVVDHRNLSRQEVKDSWPELRRGMAAEMGVQDDETEVYTGLSLLNEDSPVRERVRRLYERNYAMALKGTPPPSEPAPDADEEIGEIARAQADYTREKYLPLAESVVQGWSALKAQETKAFALPDLLGGVPGLASAVDELAELSPAERAKVYEIARSLESNRKLETGTESLGQAMLHGVRRGTADIGHSLVQGAGHIATALTQAAAESLGSDALREGASYMDKRLQALHELRSVGQGAVFPINLGEESSFLEELAVDAASATPGAVLAFTGGAGFGALALAGTGAAVAEARRRSPETRQEMQTAAGIVGGAIQAGIYMGMSRIGVRMLNRSINEFMKAGNAGARGYSLAALKTLGTLTAENARLLLAGKAAHAAELGMQELASRVDRVASNIDWEQFGDNILDIETNMREAAMNLPYVLIAAGKAALHHFRNPGAIVDNVAALEDWGVDEAARRRIQEQPDIHARTVELRKALCSSRRWSGAGSLEECLRSLCLLNTDAHTGFSKREEVRSFLKQEPDSALQKLPEPVVRDAADAETVARLAERYEKNWKSNLQLNVPYIMLYDEWYQRAQGERLQSPDAFRARAKRYLAQRRELAAALPREFRLDGYYTPYRSEVVRHVMNDQVNEIIRLSYQYLTNTETPDSMRRAFRSVERARSKVEQGRREIVGMLCAAMEQAVRTGDREEALEAFSKKLEKRYLYKHDTNANAPLWIRKTSRKDFALGELKAGALSLMGNKDKTPQLREAHLVMLGLRACAEALVDIIPHTEDFQTVLSMGYSPEDAFCHLLKREFAEHVDARKWNPPALTSAQRNDIDNKRRLERNLEACERYMELSGCTLENSPDGSGKTLWRIRRPDGQYTPWFSTYGMALNALVGHVHTLFMPTGKKSLHRLLQRGYRHAANGKTSFYLDSLFPQPHRSFTGYDHLGGTASRDLCARWLGDSTHYPMGLEFAADYKKWKKLRSDRLSSEVKMIQDGNDGYLVKLKREENPLELSRLRFMIYWHRQLSSGWVKPEDVGQTLVESGTITPERLEEVLAQGRERKLNWGYIPLKTRRVLKRRYPDGVMPGNPDAVMSDLARHMADLNQLYMLVNLQDSHLPDSVREWVYSSALFTPREPDELVRERGVVKYTNRRAAEQLQNMIPDIRRLRELMKKRGNPLHLESKLRDAYEPNEARRYEQGWCFSVGGASAFRSTGQSFWNLLEDPVRGWSLLTPEDRAELQENMRSVCRGQTPEKALQELTEVLQEYPGLRAYSSDARLGGQVRHMELDPMQRTNVADPVLSIAGNTLMMRPILVQDGFKVKEAELPAEWQADERVLPALQLLTELRRTVTAAPYSDEHGIWWKQERYGGVDGKRPKGMGSHWSAEPGLQAFMKFYEQVAEMGEAHGTHGKLNVCGVPLGGLRPEDIDPGILNLVTVYRSSRMPEHQVRLMPGEPNAANPYQRKPYVVHTADGVPLFSKVMTRYDDEIMQSFTPLNAFDSDLERTYDYASNNRHRRRQMGTLLNDLLDSRTGSLQAWEKGDESKVNNLELFMQMFQDSRLSYYLAARNPETLTRGEALAAELGRLMLLAEFGAEQEQHVQNLVEFCRKLRKDHEDKDLLLTALNRIVSPDPDSLKENEKPRPEEDRELDLDPDDAEYY